MSFSNSEDFAITRGRYVISADNALIIIYLVKYNAALLSAMSAPMVRETVQSKDKQRHG